MLKKRPLSKTSFESHVLVLVEEDPEACFPSSAFFMEDA